MNAREDPVAASHGTLVVALATPRFIVVAADSRRTSTNGGYQDDSKKIFVVRRKRILGIAGLADVSLSHLPWLTAQVAPLLQAEIDRDVMHEFEDFHWNDPPPPNELPEELREHWNASPYVWWNAVAGPVQTITNIAATYGDVDLDGLALIGILAGFKDNGQAKIERLTMVPAKGLSNFGRTYIGRNETRERNTTDGPLIWKTAGVTELAEQLLHEPITQQLEADTARYPGITTFLGRRRAGSADQILESEMVDLAKDLIRATAAITPTVGSTPIQMATIQPGKDAELDQPEFPMPAIYLPADGTWHLGVVFTPDYPFDERQSGVVFTFCEVKDNQRPISLGDNHFYGNTFERTTFVYSGGRVSFGLNNVVRNSKLLISHGVDQTALGAILRLFTTVERMRPS